MGIGFAIGIVGIVLATLINLPVKSHSTHTHFIAVYKPPWYCWKCQIKGYRRNWISSEQYYKRKEAEQN
ncbi:MAG TPA: hypothetical protein VLE47_04540 [Candidatus Saccharimonadales bacterium]|nr:hypothetical protein [Candidatus Saccharimonadales bacterium]